MQKVTIGRNPDQTYRIPDPQVSGRHAVLLINSETDMDLVDTGSTNGTFIYSDGQFVRLEPNRKYKVTGDTFVRFGPESQIHVRRLIPEEKKVDISHLRKISDDYNSRKLEIQTAQQAVQGARGWQAVFVFIGSSLGACLTAFLHTGNFFTDKVFPWILAVTLVTLGILLLNARIKKETLKIMDMQQKNEKEYGINYSCPECHRVFKGELYENVLAAGRCPACKTKFYDSTRV